MIWGDVDGCGAGRLGAGPKDAAIGCIPVAKPVAAGDCVVGGPNAGETYEVCGGAAAGVADSGEALIGCGNAWVGLGLAAVRQPAVIASKIRNEQNRGTACFPPYHLALSANTIVRRTNRKIRTDSHR